MHLLKISASTLLAAACGSAATIAMQWVYTKYFKSDTKADDICEKALEKSTAKQNDGNKVEVPRTKEGKKPAKTKKENGSENVVLRNVLQQNRETKSKAATGTGERSENGLENRDAPLQVTDDGLTEGILRETGHLLDKKEGLAIDDSVQEVEVDYLRLKILVIFFNACAFK